MTTAADESGNGHTGTYSTQPSPGTNGPVRGQTGLVADSDTAVSFTNFPLAGLLADATWSGWGQSTGAIGAMSMEYIVKIAEWGENPTFPTAHDLPGFYGQFNGYPYFHLQATRNGSNFTPTLSWYDGTTQQNVTCTDVAGWSSVHHIVITWDGTTNVRLYVDGGLNATHNASANKPHIDAFVKFTAGLPIFGLSFAQPDLSATYDEIAVYASDISSSAATHYAAIAGGGYAAAVNANSPLAYWRLGETSGTVAADASGHGRTATYQGTCDLGVTGFLTGDANKAAFFGNGPNVNVTSNQTFGPVNYANASLECVIKPAAAPGFRNQSLWGVSGASNSYFLLYIQTDTLSFGVDTDGSGGVFLSDSGHTFDGATAYHLVGTFDGSASPQANFYINGTLVQSGNASSGTLVNFDAAEVFVAGNDIWYDGYQGVLDECAFYQTTLSAARVLAHAQAGGFA